MRKYALACLFFLSLSRCYGQLYNAEKKRIEQTFSLDPRIEVRFISTMRNAGGYEGTTLIVKNLTDKSIYVEFKLHITDNCGTTITRDIKSTIKANGHIGGSTWMGGSEQYDYDSKNCTSIKYGESQYSDIRSVSLDLVKIGESGSGGQGGNPGGGSGGSGSGTGSGNSGGSGNNNNGGGTGGSGPGGGTGNTGGGGNTNNNTGGGNVSSTCAAIGLSIANGPAINCIQLRWIEQSTIQFNEKSNEIRTNQQPTDFVLYYRKLNDIYWKSQNISGYQMGYNLKMLDPCTKYEVRLQRKCGPGQFSPYSNTITFSTTCPMPSTVRAQNITSTSATINSMYSPGVNVCSVSPRAITVQIEYAAPGATWQTVLSNMGTGGSVLYNLQPNTSYRARVRFDYGNGIYSKYSNEIVFKTLN